MKKIDFYILILLSVIFCLSSCNADVFYDELFRTTSDPFDDAPVTESLTREHTIYLSWNEDKGTDNYRLMRAIDNNTLVFNVFTKVELLVM